MSCRYRARQFSASSRVWRIAWRNRSEPPSRCRSRVPDRGRTGLHAITVRTHRLLRHTQNTRLARDHHERRGLRELSSLQRIGELIKLAGTRTTDRRCRLGEHASAVCRRTRPKPTWRRCRARRIGVVRLIDAQDDAAEAALIALAEVQSSTPLPDDVISLLTAKVRRLGDGASLQNGRAACHEWNRDQKSYSACGKTVWRPCSNMA